MVTLITRSRPVIVSKYARMRYGLLPKQYTPRSTSLLLLQVRCAIRETRSTEVSEAYLGV